MRAEQTVVQEFLLARPVMLENNANPARMADLLQTEVDELKAEIMEGNTDKIAQELPDVVFFLFTIAELHGIDLENAFYAKTLRNEHKYKEEMFDGSMTYEEAATLCRTMWNRDNDVNFTPDSI
jgi:NTP pyrophosphatase (non-canonical NTP hydrolase)